MEATAISRAASDASGKVSIALKRVSTIISVVVVTAMCAACAERPENGFLSADAMPSPGETSHTLLVATTRERDARPGTLFNGERAPVLDYAQVTLAIPPKHVKGAIELPTTPPGNPETDFVVRNAAYIDGEKQFLRALNSQLAMRPRGSRKVLLFIHGYNTMFAEGIYRLSQVVHDAEAPGVPVLFTWASRGKLTEYVYDNNSATTARDDLERTIRLLFASDADQINILAHSMGNWVTIEALRQIKMTGPLPQIGKLGSVFLAAPDIDIDVFKSQMRRFGKPRKPFYVVLSKDDKALQLSNFIAGGESRLGATGNAAELTALGAVVIDLTDIKGTDASNHDKFAQIADVAPKLQSVLAQGVGFHPGDTSRGVPSAGGSFSEIVAFPVSILGAPIKIITGQ